MFEMAYKAFRQLLVWESVVATEIFRGAQHAKSETRLKGAWLLKRD